MSFADFRIFVPPNRGVRPLYKSAMDLEEKSASGPYSTPRFMREKMEGMQMLRMDIPGSAVNHTSGVTTSPVGWLVLGEVVGYEVAKKISCNVQVMSFAKLFPTMPTVTMRPMEMRTTLKWVNYAFIASWEILTNIQRQKGQRHLIF